MKNKKTILVITSYPSKDTLHDKGVSGLAGFAKNTILHIPKENTNLIVLAEKDNSPKEYQEEGVLIKRVWKKNSISLYFALLKELISYRKVSDTILLEFEFAVFGSMLTTGFMPLFILISKILGYRTVTVMHQVILDISIIAQHLGIPEKGAKTSTINFFMQIFNRVLSRLSSKIIVLDEVHRRNLGKIVNIKKVITIPHGVEQKDIDVIQKNSGADVTLLYFGHLTWYKGADWLIQSYVDFSKEHPEIASRFRILLAGGESPTQKNNPQYMQFYKKIKQLAESSENITITGFVKEEDFGKIFNSADIQILPYRAMMSSSGPLSWAFSYEKPVLISNVISPFLQTEDIKNLISKNGLRKEDIVFNLDDPEELFLKISQLDAEMLNKLKSLSKGVKDSRDWEVLGREYERVLND